MHISARTLALAGACVFLVVLPGFGSDYFVDFVMTRTLMLGLAASTVVFLSSYVGMNSPVLGSWPQPRFARYGGTGGGTRSTSPSGPKKRPETGS